jgi:glycosyltransferase involved in cell wall biosynthesis
MTVTAETTEPTIDSPVDGGGRRVLLIGAFAPPRGGPNAQRVGALAEYLSSWGWRVDLHALRTPEPQAIERVMHDRMTAAGAEVTWHDAPLQPSPWPWRIDGEQPWAERVAAELSKAEHRSSWDVVLATSPPFSALWAGRAIAGTHDIPFVIDLQDPWSLAELWPFRSAVHRAMARRMHRAITEASTFAVMNCAEAARAVRDAFEMDERRVTHVENGFDASEVEPVPPALREVPDDAFLLTHIGTMMTEEGLRESGLIPMSMKSRISALIHTRGAAVNALAKSSYYLLKALRHGLDKDGDEARRVRLEFIGPWSNADQGLVDDLKLAGHVLIRPFSTRTEAMARCKAADAVVLPLHTRRDGRPIRIVPSKTYDYLASGRPMLCLAEPCDAWSFAEAAGCGVRATPDDPAAIWAAVRSLMAGAGSEHVGLASPMVARFDWPNLVARVSRILDGVTAGVRRKAEA